MEESLQDEAQNLPLPLKREDATVGNMLLRSDAFADATACPEVCLDLTEAFIDLSQR